ncbi:MAG: YedE family putative selenium transporter [Candidatus Eisenbacteria bacterium]
MRSGLTRFFASRTGIILTGAIIGGVAVLLQKLGNPPNMGICVACFERDIAGALGLHRAGVVQYLRPEIFAFVLGSLIAALAFREFRPRGGSAPIARFVLGAFAMIGALAFLGCPWRALLRLAGGDLGALFGLAGLTAGVFAGVWFLRNGYSLGRAHAARPLTGWLMPILMAGGMLLALLRPGFIFASEAGPGSMHAPILASLAAGLLIGVLAQRTRFCTMGAIRDIFIARDVHLLSGVAALLIVAFGVNLLAGQFHLGARGQPVAHGDHVWSFLGMTLAGLAFALAGGCPGRQLFMAGEGDGDAGIFVIGMISGAAFAHNFGLGAVPDKIVEGVTQVGGPAPDGQAAVLIGLALCLALGFGMRERWAQATAGKGGSR